MQYGGLRGKQVRARSHRREHKASAGTAAEADDVQQLAAWRTATPKQDRRLGCAPGRTPVKADPRYFRPTEVGSLIADASKARDLLGWQPEISFDELVHKMVWQDVNEARKDELVRARGFRVYQFRE